MSSEIISDTNEDIDHNKSDVSNNKSKVIDHSKRYRVKYQGLPKHAPIDLNTSLNIICLHLTIKRNMMD